MIRILLDSIPTETFELLRQGLNAEAFELYLTAPAEGFSVAVKRSRPHIAVLDRVQQRQGETQRKIEILRMEWAGVRIIAISEASSIEDASIIEQGVFYYMTSTEFSELKRIIEAAAVALTRTDDRQFHGVDRE
ncbi:MAG: hypothetical protein IID30_05180 [Planctomycetes bacterium]|nr:hypothetical protein [Planctomycetota bacterium]